ncbi:GmrSD restriction endonuclease domain-containing protein [Leuconostoc gasicomitatum]|uniref:GmrSD restriction endonuclease domain-containing protein n=1 Tax=Leuconostoc gasicomitatum TaxID=115778 RepID=UPI0007DEC86C|nr:DUF262 domain-containing protein [Leuconostoc gasicomitatum]CUW17830.1 hypothetical protein PB1E_1969 [Leuconostoc gasicomitatum]
MLISRKYQIPDFQREFTWGKSDFQTLAEDILQSEKKSTTPFLGTFMFIGVQGDDVVKITDGQQRLTSIFIFLACLRDKLYEIKKDNYADAIQERFLCQRDNENSLQATLETNATYKYVDHIIVNKNPYYTDDDFDKNNDEIQKFKVAQKVFGKSLERHSNQSDKEYFNWLSSIRDTITSAFAINLFSAEKKEAYLAFESLNSKGQPLSDLDLIKNRIIYTAENQHFVAKFVDIWRSAREKNAALKQKIFVGYRDHDSIDQWLMISVLKSNSVLDENIFPRGNYWLYKSFTNYFTNFNEGIDSKYLKIINQFEVYSEALHEIYFPNRNNWNSQTGKRIYRNFGFLSLLLNSDYVNDPSLLDMLTELFMVAYHKCKSTKYFNDTLLLEITDFILGSCILFGVVSQASQLVIADRGKQVYFRSSLENSLHKFNSISTKADAYTIVSELKTLLFLFHRVNKHNALFSSVHFTKKTGNDKIKRFENVTSKYILECVFLLENNVSLVDQGMSVEHIVPESTQKDYSDNLGNLTLLEDSTNSGAADTPVREKVKNYYPQSRNKDVLQLVIPLFQNITHQEEKTKIDERTRILESKFFSYSESLFRI